MKRKISSIKTMPFQGGCNTAVEPALLDGKPSMVQNFRQKHPGFIKRAGQIKQHSTSTTTTPSKVLSMYQFVKGKKTERHFYAQMSDDDVWEATTAPPGVTTGEFGSKVFTGASSSVPASWANVNDLLLFANGVDTSQIYPGTASPVEKFIVYKGTAAIPTIPEIGDDYTTEVTDGLTTTGAVLDSLGDLAVDFDCIFVMVPVPIDTLNWTIKAANATASASGANYWNGSAWTAVDSFNDTTDSGSATLAINGTMAWTLPTAHVPSFMYGVVGFWYQIYLASGDLDSETEVSAVTFESDWQAMQSIWDGVPVPAVECQTYHAATDAYYVYGSEAVELGGLVDTVDFIYVAATDPAIGFDISGTPYSPIGSDITDIKYWNGTTWSALTGITDNTDGFTKSGWITFSPPADISKYMFRGSPYYAYWYRIACPKAAAIVCMNCDGADGSVTVTDLSGKSWTPVGNTQLDTAQKKYGTASLLFDGTGDTLRTLAHSGFNFGTGDFTIEFWTRVANLDAAKTLFAFSCSKSSITDYFYIQVVAAITTGVTTANIKSETSDVVNLQAINIAVGTISAATWHHIVFMRKDGVFQCFLDGVAAAKATATTDVGPIYYDGVTFYSFDWQLANPYLINGWVDDIRISKYAVYAIDTNFTAPTSAIGIAVGGTLPANTTVGFSTAPYFDITDFGKVQTVCSWKNRLSMSTVVDHYTYLSTDGLPQSFNGDDSAILAPGDGRYNRPVAQKKLQDDLIIFQEEKGADGGCVTKYSWVSSVNDIQKTILSTTLGTMNSKSVDIADGVEYAELNRDVPIMSVLFFLSRKGVFVTDGSTVYMISQDINNYFDPTNSASIRVGYEAEMWLKYDSAYGVVRLGLVSGASATVPNVFPVYDVKDKTWGFDVLTQPLSCMVEAEAGSGTAPVVQLGGGTADGTVYVLNSGLNDVSAAIDSYVTQEIDGNGEILNLSELLLRAKVQSAGNITVTPSLNSIAQTAMTFAQTAEVATQTIRRHRTNMNLTGQHISLKIQHNTESESCLLLDMGAGLSAYEEQ